MIALFLLACDVSLESTDTADTAAPTSDMATCLADGGALVERAVSDPWTSALQDLELNDTGKIYVLSEDGHLLLADPADPSAWADQADLGSSNEGDEMIDVSGDAMLVNQNGVRTGKTSTAMSAWSTVADLSLIHI